MNTSRFALVGVLLSLGCGGGGDNTMNDAGGKDVTVNDVTTDSPVVDSSNDVATDAPDPCGSAPTLNYYVDTAKGADSNSGAGPNCAMKTITAALAASAGDAHDNAQIHVAAGTYGAGETFPIAVNHGRSIIGAGAAMTTIQGASASFNTSGTGSLLDTGTHFVTMIAGDIMGGTNMLGATTISGVTLLPPTSVTTPTTNYLGIVCITGNAPNVPAMPPLPAANLVVKNVTAGPNYDLALTISYSPTLQTACNASILGSTFVRSNVGVATGACGGSSNPNNSWPSAIIGDGMMADANTFTSTDIGVFGQGCGSVQSINMNKFTSGYRGIVLISVASQYFEILSNTFDGSSLTFGMGMGINTNSSAAIAKLNDNTFSNISQSNAADSAVGATTGYALALGGGSVLQALRNKIANNDNGILLNGAPANTFDFSSGGTPANTNQIYCNSKASGNGYDLVLGFTGGSAVNFAGDTWDHSAPSTSVSLTTSPNGTDVVTGTSAGATLTSSIATSTACTGSRVH